MLSSTLAANLVKLGIAPEDDSPPVPELCDRLVREDREALSGVACDPFPT